MNRYESEILFPSVTYANKARYFLNRTGIDTKMERIPETRKGRTCGYRLLLAKEKLPKALELCKQNGIRITEYFE